jgi:hypothetical protein
MTRGAAPGPWYALYSPGLVYALGLGVVSKLSGNLGAPVLVPSGTALHYPHAATRAAALALFERVDLAGQPACASVCKGALAVYTRFLSPPAQMAAGPTVAAGPAQTAALKPWEKGYGCEGVPREQVSL